MIMEGKKAECYKKVFTSYRLLLLLYFCQTYTVRDEHILLLLRDNV